MRAKAWYNHLQHFYERKKERRLETKSYSPPEGGE